MAEQKNKITLKLSPMVRWMLSFDKEVETFPNTFNRELLKDLAQRFTVAEGRVRHLAQTMVKVDLLLLLALYAPNLNNINIFGQDISALSFLAELLLIASAFNFLMLVWSFTTSRCYESMVQSICNRQVDDPRWNGRYLTAALIDQELTLHVASQRLSFDQLKQDHWSAGRGMAALERMSKLSIILAIWPMFLLHLGVTCWGIVVIPIRAAAGLPLDLVISVFVLLTCVYSIAFAIRLYYIEQKFDARIG